MKFNLISAGTMASFVYEVGGKAGVSEFGAGGQFFNYIFIFLGWV